MNEKLQKRLKQVLSFSSSIEKSGRLRAIEDIIKGETQIRRAEICRHHSSHDAEYWGSYMDEYYGNKETLMVGVSNEKQTMSA
jgi:hypothetical protein